MTGTEEESGEAPFLAICLAGPLHEYFLRQPSSSYMHVTVWQRTRHFLSPGPCFPVCISVVPSHALTTETAPLSYPPLFLSYPETLLKAIPWPESDRFLSNLSSLPACPPHPPFPLLHGPLPQLFPFTPHSSLVSVPFFHIHYTKTRIMATTHHL